MNCAYRLGIECPTEPLLPTRVFLHDAGCGERNEASRIVGGQETAANTYPWVARLSYFNKFYCGGMLVNDRYVLTAAHCAKGLFWFMLRVTFGEHDRCARRRRPHTRYVVHALVHNFTFQDFRDDIALLKVNQALVIGDTVKPICLPHSDAERQTSRRAIREYMVTVALGHLQLKAKHQCVAGILGGDRIPNGERSENYYEGVKAIAAGWGSITETKNHSCVLREVELPVMSNAACKNTSYESEMISDGMMCAGYPEGMKDTCQGDSGGPLAAERGDNRYELLGEMSNFTCALAFARSSARLDIKLLSTLVHRCIKKRRCAVAYYIHCEKCLKTYLTSLSHISRQHFSVPKKKKGRGGPRSVSTTELKLRAGRDRPDNGIRTSIENMTLIANEIDSKSS
ncbi:Serine proteinase stubble [Eumeta japonica]|uniref:Serine proteinase stubble n=1 Tax=Eumeta variegata TaxID=151549 RepID=A0A4C1TLF8_EUMVA|nr:Serine proteinase stubble [Eumeta japonica]